MVSLFRSIHIGDNVQQKALRPTLLMFPFYMFQSMLAILWYSQCLIDVRSHGIAVCKHIGWVVFDACIVQYADSMP